MAVQVTTGGWGDAKHGGLVVRDSNGIPYVLAQNNDTMYKGNGTTPTSFSSQGAATTTINVTPVAMCIDANDIIHAIFSDLTNKTEDITYETFDTSTDSWAGSQATIASYTADGTTYMPSADICVDSNNIPHVCWVDGVNNMGTAYATVYYSNRVGGSWNTPVQVEGTSNQVNCSASSIAINRTNNAPQIAYVERTNNQLMLASSTTNNPSSFTLNVRLNTGAYNTIAQNPQLAYDSSNNEFILYATTTTLSLYDHANTTSRTVASSSWETNGSWAICPVGTDIYVFYCDNDTDQNVEYDMWDGSSWLGRTELMGVASLDFRYVSTTHRGEVLRGSDGTNYPDASSSVPEITIVGGGISGIQMWFETISLGGTAYTLAISAGSYAVTGQAVGLLADRTLTVSAGTYAVTGQDVALSHGYILTVSAGTYTTVGQDVSLLADRTLTVSAGTYTVVGQDVSLIKGYTLVVDAGSYTVTGQDVGLTKQWILVPEAGSYAVTGQDVTLLADRTLTIDAGSYAVTGQDVGLLKGYVLIPSAGTYTTTGQDVSLLLDRTLTVSAGTYSVVGQDVTLTKGFTMVVDAGSYAVTGQDVNLLADRIITIDPGSYAVTGQDVSLTKGFTMFVSAGTYTTVGQDVTLLLDRVLAISAGTYTTTGQDVNLLADRVLALDSGTYSVNGQDVTLLKAHLLTIETGNYTYSGQDVTLIYTPGSGSTQKRIILIT